LREEVPIEDLDPVRAASLTDAALTPYQAIKRVLPRLVGGSTTVVIGAGGLGHVAIQLLRELTPTRVIALDIGEDKLAFAKDNGAHEAFTSNAEAAEKVKSLTRGRGATVILDFVGADVTGELAVACGGVGSAVVVIGAGMGGAKVGLTSSPYNMTVSTSLWGRRKELLELVEMAKRGQIKSRPRRTRSRPANRPTPTCAPARSSAERSWCPEGAVRLSRVAHKAPSFQVRRSSDSRSAA